MDRSGVRSKKASPAAALISATGLEAGQSQQDGGERPSATLQSATALHYHHKRRVHEEVNICEDV